MIFKLIPHTFKNKGLLVTLFVPIRAIMDLVGVAVLLPMLILVLDNDALTDNEFLYRVYNTCNFASYDQFVFSLVVAVLGIIVLKSVINLLFINYQNKYLLSLYRYFSRSLFSHLYRKGLLYVKNSNTAEITFNINAVCYNFGVSYLASLLKFSGDLLFCIFLLIALCFYNPLSSLFIVCSFLPIIFIYLRVVRSRLKEYGQKEMEARRQQQKVVQETFKGYAEMEINNAFPLMQKRFESGLGDISGYRVKTSLIQSIPSYLLEIAVALVVSVLVIFSLNASDASLRVFLGVFTVAMIRMLPAVHGLIGTWSNIKATQYTVDVISQMEDDIATEKTTGTTTVQPMKFEKEIKVKDLSFSYSDTNVIDHLSFDIRKGERFGIRGRTGAGKSTLFNLLLGLIPPKEGTIQIDGVPLTGDNIFSWHSIVGYVPQDVFIADLSIAENVALGEDLENIDLDRVLEVLKQVSLDKLVLSLPKGLHSVPGEGGSRISGGQRQRIGIARALYKRAEVLFFDEATSSLDTETEKEISDAIRELSGNNKKMTIIIISHRPSTLEICDRILDIK